MCPLPWRERAAQRFDVESWVRGYFVSTRAITPHPSIFVEYPSSPLPQGERAQSLPPCSQDLPHRPLIGDHLAVVRQGAGRDQLHGAIQLGDGLQRVAEIGERRVGKECRS